jgi:hypothetical protein
MDLPFDRIPANDITYGVEGHVDDLLSGCHTTGHPNDAIEMSKVGR